MHRGEAEEDLEIAHKCNVPGPTSLQECEVVCSEWYGGCDGVVAPCALCEPASHVQGDEATHHVCRQGVQVGE